jgi:4-cresol dehydrogenase (hydroxylating) flavoprotein subunit
MNTTTMLPAELVFLEKVDMGQRVLKFMPSTVGIKLDRTLQQTRAHLDILEGKPSEVALSLAYWRSGVSKPASNLDPARDSCGLLWYAPLVPIKQEIVRGTVDMVRKVCLEHKIEPLMTLTALSNRCFDLTLPILFSQKDAVQAAGAPLFRATLRGR